VFGAVAQAAQDGASVQPVELQRAGDDLPDIPGIAPQSRTNRVSARVTRKSFAAIGRRLDPNLAAESGHTAHGDVADPAVHGGEQRVAQYDVVEGVPDMIDTVQDFHGVHRNRGKFFRGKRR
jgi:hypothetical protein